MKAKEYLGQLERWNTQIQQKLLQVKELRELRGNLGSFDYSKERVQTSGCSNTVEESTIKLLTLENEVQQDIINYAIRKDQIVNEIHTLNDPIHINLLFKRYVEFKRLEVISVEMGYTYPYIRELHGVALQNFQSSYTNLQRNVI